MKVTTSPITIRLAHAGDENALARLAALDSAERVPTTPILLAEVDGEMLAALSLEDGSVVADPFRPTRDLVSLLRAHAQATMRQRPRSRRFRYRLRFA